MKTRSYIFITQLLVISSYFPPAYPWTRLGYTYDWGNDSSEIGLSEFVIRKNSQVYIESKISTQECLDE